MSHVLPSSFMIWVVVSLVSLRGCYSLGTIIHLIIPFQQRFEGLFYASNANFILFSCNNGFWGYLLNVPLFLFYFVLLRMVFRFHLCSVSCFPIPSIFGRLLSLRTVFCFIFVYSRGSFLFIIAFFLSFSFSRSSRVDFLVCTFLSFSFPRIATCIVSLEEVSSRIEVPRGGKTVLLVLSSHCRNMAGYLRGSQGSVPILSSYFFVEERKKNITKKKKEETWS